MRTHAPGRHKELWCFRGTRFVAQIMRAISRDSVLVTKYLNNFVDFKRMVTFASELWVLHSTPITMQSYE